MTTEIDRFERALKHWVPEARISVDSPLRAEGRHWIDVRLAHRLWVLSWCFDEGFGFYDEKSPGFGQEAPISTISDPASAASHATLILDRLGWPIAAPISGGTG